MLGTVGELARRVGGRAIGDTSVALARLTSIDDAETDALTFATTPSYLQAALASKAAAVLVDEKLAQETQDPPKPLIAVASPRVALALLLQAFVPPRKRGPYRHPTAVVHDQAVIGPDVYIGAHAVVGSGSRIGARVVLEDSSYIGSDVQVGEDSILFPHACVLDRCVLGDRVTLRSGSVIGSEGFGWAFIEDQLEPIPQIGNVILGNDVDVGANSCVDRAQTGSTQIGDGTKIDNLCQIGHNCKIGKHCALAALTGLAGSTILGDYVLVGGASGFSGHLTVGSRARIGGGSAVWKDIPDGGFFSGNPARPHSQQMRREALVRNLPKLVARVEALEKQNK